MTLLKLNEIIYIHGYLYFIFSQEKSQSNIQTEIGSLAKIKKKPLVINSVYNE